ncbi:MAG: hypothetical protein QM758_07305 [Armatimonas sp.]
MKKTPSWETWNSVFLTMILVPNLIAALRSSPPVNAKAALASLAFRIIVAMVGICGLITIHFLKKGAEKASALEGSPLAASEPAAFSANNAIVLPYQSTKVSMWRCEKWALFHQWEHLTPVLFMGLIMGIGLGAASSAKLGVPNWLGVVLGIPLAIAGWTLVILGLTHLLIQARLASSGGVRKLESVITREGLIERRPEGISHLPWSSLSRFQFCEGDIFMRSGMQGVYIPREAFESTAEAERIFGILTALHTSKGERWKEFAPRPEYDLE